MLQTIAKLLKNKKKPTFIKKVDKWQTEMYLYKLQQERNLHNR